MSATNVFGKSTGQNVSSQQLTMNLNELVNYNFSCKYTALFSKRHKNISLVCKKFAKIPDICQKQFSAESNNYKPLKFKSSCSLKQKSHFWGRGVGSATRTRPFLCTLIQHH